MATNSLCFWTTWIANQYGPLILHTDVFMWVTVALETTGNMVMLGCALLSVWEHTTGAISPGTTRASLLTLPGQLGLGLSYAVQLPGLLGWVLKQYSQVSQFVAGHSQLSFCVRNNTMLTSG